MKTTMKTTMQRLKRVKRELGLVAKKPRLSAAERERRRWAEMQEQVQKREQEEYERMKSTRLYAQVQSEHNHLDCARGAGGLATPDEVEYI